MLHEFTNHIFVTIKIKTKTQLHFIALKNTPTTLVLSSFPPQTVSNSHAIKLMQLHHYGIQRRRSNTTLWLYRVCMNYCVQGINDEILNLKLFN